MKHPAFIGLDGRGIRGRFARAAGAILCVAAFLAAGVLPVSAQDEAAKTEDREVYFFNWTEYVPEGILDQFTEETGIKVHYSEYESNEALYAKIKMLEGGGGYDLIVPSSYYVARMRKDGLLAPLDKGAIPNLANLDPSYLDKPFDPGNACSVPYMWGGTGIFMNTKTVDPATVTSWTDLWKKEFAGNLLFQDDLREVFGMALLRLGYSINDTEPKHIRRAYDLLKAVAPGVRVYNSDSPKMPFLSGEVGIGMIWSGEAFLAMQESPDFAFVWPKEGGIMWMDCLAVPKGARHPAEAAELINFLLRPDIAKRTAEEIGYATPNKAAWETLPPEVRDNPVIYPGKAVLERSEFINYIGEALPIYEEYWHKLKTGE